MEKQHLWGFCPYTSPCSVPCGVFATPWQCGGRWGCAGGCSPQDRQSDVPGSWPSPTLLYAIAAGGTTSSLQGRAGALTLAKGEGRGSSTSQGQQHEQQGKGGMHHRQWGAGCMMSLGAARRGCCECGVTQHRHKTGLLSPWETGRKQGILQAAKCCSDQTYRGERAKLEGKEV